MSGTGDDPRAFTLHRDSGWPAVVVGLLLVTAVEALPVHLWLARSHPVWAWSLTALAAGTAGWLLTDLRALGRRPTRLEDDHLLVRVGSRWTLRVPLAAIAALEPVRGEAPARGTPGYLRATVVGDPRFVLTLREPALARGPLGLERAVTRVGLAPDDPARFERLLRAGLERARATGGTSDRSGAGRDHA